MQQRLLLLCLQHIIDANNMLKELLTLKPELIFEPPQHTTHAEFCTFSDASHPRDRDYGLFRVFLGVNISCAKSSNDIFHPIPWSSTKQRKVSYSFFEAEILAATQADDRGYYYTTAFQFLLPKSKLQHLLIVDSRAVYDTMTTFARMFGVQTTANSPGNKKQF